MTKTREMTMTKACTAHVDCLLDPALAAACATDQDARGVDSDRAKFMELVAEVTALVGDDGTGDLGVTVRQALANDPETTSAEIAEIVRDARVEAERSGR